MHKKDHVFPQIWEWNGSLFDQTMIVFTWGSSEPSLFEIGHVDLEKI